MSDISTTPPFEIPTPGRIVYIYDRLEDPDRKHPVPAGVVKVLDAEKGILAVDPWDDEGNRRGTIEVPHASDLVSPNNEWDWDWMPYQKGQLKKLEQVQAIEQPGLRRLMTIKELDNRFTYHSPSPEQVGKYADIRAEAKNFAIVLQHHCPPSPELAAALDALDTCVFKANAAIARHTPQTQD